MRLPLSLSLFCLLFASGRADVEESGSNSTAADSDSDSDYGTIVYVSNRTRNQGNDSGEYTYGTVIYHPNQRTQTGGSSSGSFDTLRNILRQQTNATESNHTVAKRSINEQGEPAPSPEYQQESSQDVRSYPRLNARGFPGAAQPGQAPAAEILDVGAADIVRDFSVERDDVSYNDDRTDQDPGLEYNRGQSVLLLRPELAPGDRGNLDVDVEMNSDREYTQIRISVKNNALRQFIREFFSKHSVRMHQRTQAERESVRGNVRELMLSRLFV